MEDVWLGSLLHRFPPKAPISYVNLFGGRQSAGLVVDQWDFRMTRAALLCHVITKQPNRLLALHDLVQQPGNHCPRPFRLRCSPDCSTRPEATAGPRRAASDCGRPNQWCVVERKPRPHDACCSDEGGSNRSCSATFGSNAWPKRYEAAWQRALASSSSRPRRRDAT